MPRVLTPARAAELLVTHHGLRRPLPGPPAAACRALLGRLRHIQLDPLDMIGTNADLVAMARVDGLARGEVYAHLLPGHAFEHFAKERCLLPAEAFPWYRGHIAETDWWSLTTRLDRLPDGLVERALELVQRHGPGTAEQIERRAIEAGDVDEGGLGRVVPMDWSGWKGTARALSMAFEVLWTRCEIVVCGRDKRGKIWDVPARALPEAWARGPLGASREDFLRWALIDRVAAAGLLARAGGAHWSMLSEVRATELPEALLTEGVLEEVVIEGARRTYLAPAGFCDAGVHDDDGRMRILGPLDPLLWDRKLVSHAFGFDYVWEVYKPAAQRTWGYYVCPLLHRGALVGRFEGRLGAHGLEVLGLWKEPGARFEQRAFKAALARHEAALLRDPVTP